MPNSTLHQSLQRWLDTAIGQYLMEQEQTFYDSTVSDIFGYNAVQISFPEFDFLRNNRMPFRFVVGLEKGSSAYAHPHMLPIGSRSIDLVLLPHTLEFFPNPHQILREVHRILIPEGKIIISGFNPFSPWGLHQRITTSKNEFPWCGNFIALPRMKDWLTLLGLETNTGKLCCYIPPCGSKKWISRLRFMEAAGDRWWPIGGGVYFLQAVKHERGVRIIKPCWENSPKTRSASVTPQIDRQINSSTAEKNTSHGAEFNQRIIEE